MLQSYGVLFLMEVVLLDFNHATCFVVLMRPMLHSAKSRVTETRFETKSDAQAVAGTCWDFDLSFSTRDLGFCKISCRQDTLTLLPEPAYLS